MHRFAAIYYWDLLQGIRNRFLQVFTLFCAMGGVALLAASPGPETVPIILIDSVLFFASLLAIMVGWSSGQQTRSQGAFLFAQPIGALELVVAKLLGTGTWCILLLLIFLSPLLSHLESINTLLPFIYLTAGYLLVCLLIGLLIGLTSSSVSGLLAALTVWVVMIFGWELGLMLLAQLTEITQYPALFVTLLLTNPAGVFRVGSLVGMETFRFDASELGTSIFVFHHVKLVSVGIFAIWSALIFILTGWRVSRQEF